MTSCKTKRTFWYAIAPCMSMFITGSVFSLGVFTVPVEQNASIPGSLDGVWPSSMGLMHLFSAPVMILTGLFLDGGSPHHVPTSPQPFGFSKTDRVRILSTVSSLCYLGFALAAVATSISSPLLVRIAIGLQSVPLGVNYLLISEVLTAWFPQTPGFVVGCALLAYGGGVVVQSWLFSRAISAFGCANALYVTAFGLSLPSLMLTTLFSWPKGESIATESLIGHEQDPLLSDMDTSLKLSWRKLRSLRQFWFYVAIVFTGGAPYAFISYFFKLGHVFGRTPELMVTIFQVFCIINTVVGLLAGWATDVLHFGKGFFKSGAKNLAVLTLLAQVVLFAVLVPLSNTNNFWGFIIAAGALVVLTASHYGCAATLARDLFGPANSCIVFGIGAGLSVGTGEGVSAEVMSAVERASSLVDGSLVPSSYNVYYWIGMFWTLSGLVCALLIEACEEAFEQRPISPFNKEEMQPA